jgi:hypothetical protein
MKLSSMLATFAVVSVLLASPTLAASPTGMIEGTVASDELTGVEVGDVVQVSLVSDDDDD